MLLHADQVEELMQVLIVLDRTALVSAFRNYPARFPVDFSDEFLRNTPVERLRHIFLAMCLQTGRMPAFEPAALAA